jgi:hypothetical protein
VTGQFARLLLVVCLGLLRSNVLAAEPEQPIVRISVDPQSVVVGEHLTMRVRVLVPTWFPKPPVFPDFELPNTITRLPSDSSGPVTEQVGLKTWSGIERRYRIYPLLGAAFELTGRKLEVTYANPGSREPLMATIQVPDVSFNGLVPDGAQALNPYLAATSLTINREIDGALGSLAANDALVVTYTISIKGMPAMFLPPIAPLESRPGMRVYADEPTLSNESWGATRVEKVTYVFASGGDYQLPAVSVTWWNTQTRTIAVAQVDALELTVRGPALQESAGYQDKGALPWRATVALLLMAVLIWRYRRLPGALRRIIQTRRQRFEASEAFAFSGVLDALNAGQPHLAHQQLLNWLARLEPDTDLRKFLREYATPALCTEIDALSAALYGAADNPPELRGLAGPLKQARQRFLEARRAGELEPLPPLNPG